MSKKYSAKITKENFSSFVAYCNKHKKWIEEIMKKTAELFGYYSDFYKTAKEMFYSWEGQSYTFRLQNSQNIKLKMIMDYLAEKDLSWQVIEKKENILHLNFSGNRMLWLEEFCTLSELPDYENISMAQISSKLEGSGISTLLPAEINSLSIHDVKEKKNTLEEKETELKKKQKEIQYEQTKELEKMKEEIEKMKDALYKKKQKMLSDLNKKMSIMQEEMTKMRNQIYMMESEIYTIRSYSGETVELHKIRSGRKATPDTPLVINQKLMYLDEDLARIISVYQDEISTKYQMFADAAAANDEVFESFCPQDRCLTFFRLSRHATYSSYNHEMHMYETEYLIHGKKMGFLLRDLDCAYIGWLDESWNSDVEGKPVPVTFEENLMYQPKVTDIHELPDSQAYEFQDSQNSMLSRLFSMAVVQGIIDNKGLLEFPEKVTITKPSTYISYNFAVGWIMDDRFGDFATLVENLNKRTKVEDQILVCKNKIYCLEGRGKADRTHDCEVPTGMNKINFLESDEYGRCTIYVSAKKRHSLKGATANVLCNPREYINITYMNSIWLKYYIQTKKLGNYAEDYAEMIKHFKKALEIIINRENKEMHLIKEYLPKADKIPEWQLLLSHWKLNHHIRFINKFQAKRVAAYLKAGDYKENAHLFEHENYYNGIDETDNGNYSHTIFSDEYIYHKKETGMFAIGSNYHKQRFYLKDYDDSMCLHEEKKKEQEENNAYVIARDMPALEAQVPERLCMDEAKLFLVRDYLGDFFKTNNITVKELKHFSQYTGMIYDMAHYMVGFVTLDAFTPEMRESVFKEMKGLYPEYILKSDCWKVAYYDYIHRQYVKVLHDAKVILHKRHMSEVNPYKCC